MKKLQLLILVMGLLLTINSSGQSLSYRFVNPKISNSLGVNYFEFDVQALVSVATYFYTGQIIINFDNTAFSTNAADWTITKGTLLNGLDPTSSYFKYGLVKTLTGSPFVCNLFITSDVASLPMGGDPGYYNQFTTSYQQFAHYKVKITNTSGIAGIRFITSSMSTYQSFITLPNTYTYYSGNTYGPTDFANTYLGRIYAANTWTQIGGTVNWATSVNTSVWDGAATIPTTGLSLASNLRIDNPATLTIPNTGQLTVTGATEINTVNGLTIQSDATGTGSLITGTASGTGSAIAQRWMTAGGWHLVAPPLAGQDISAFLTANGNIATNVANRGMMDFNPVTNGWNNFFTNSILGSFNEGVGYSMRVGASNAAVTFSGIPKAGNKSPVTVAGSWNCVGNPYTSAIGINTGSSSATNFLKVNAIDASNLDPSYSAVYVWEKSDAQNGQTGQYSIISNTPISIPGAVGTPLDVQQGQAFFVKMQTGVSLVNFTPAMQIHSTGLALKSTGSVWPTIKLDAVLGEQKSSTIIAFNSRMTKGLDPTYDAGLFKGSSDLLVYSKLVEDNGIPFAIQALPDNEFSNMIIPVGIDSKTGGDLVFSAEIMNLPSDCNVILEDKLNKTFTDLSEKDYTVTIAANSSISDRFQLHTSNLTTGIADGTMADKLSAYAFRNIEIRVKGNVGKQAVATLYDIQGRAVVVKNLAEGSLNTIPTPNIKTGIYMLYVKDNGKVQGFKIPVTE